MSLTSYRAAPSRGKAVCEEEGFEDCALTAKSCVSGRPRGDLLSRALRRSTIGSGGLNDRVRNGIGWGTSDIATRSTEQTEIVKTLSDDRLSGSIIE